MHTHPDSAAEPRLWMVMAVVQPHRLDAVTLALEHIPGLGGMTVSECRGFGRGKVAAEEPEPSGAGDRAPRRRSTDLGLVDFTAKVKLEIAVAGAERAHQVVDVITRAAHTGRPGDGKVFLWPLDHVVRVRTREEDADAL
ncbi:MAG TPA: P-II family nitrogen regulator [Longimicrobiaceae bacterium]|nr:P-II family nitrogen regulator [Longimicrobiaceae bacterium]